MSEWRDIESAPRDGTEILLYRPDAHKTRDPTYAVGRGVSEPRTSPQGVVHYTDRWCHPTLWMPIPPLPSPPETENNG